jgi:uncharacterized protein
MQRSHHATVLGVTFLTLLGGSAMGGEPAGANPVRAKGEKKLEVFDYRGVTLDGGRMRMQLDEVCDDYLRICNDDLLKGFRRRAGLPAPGKELGGLYSRDVWNVFGQIISGLSRLYAVTGNPALRDKADTLLAEWAKCIGPDGHFYYTRHPNAPHYIYDKMVWGLLDAHLYCGNKEAPRHLSRITDWAVKNLARGHDGAKNIEWYTLSENLYRAYLVTGDPKYREFARVWEYPEYWDLYARKDDIFARRPDGTQVRSYHAYSHVNTLGGAGAAYLVTGEPRYLAILKNAYDYLQANQVFATGGYGPNEQLAPRDRLLAMLADTPNSFETQCGTWACFKMVKYLLCDTADARYGDWAERLALNGLGASIHMSTDGRVFYYSDYRPSGGEKVNYGDGWSCCTGTRPQAVADFSDLIYFKDQDNLYVNLFASSTVHWPHGGAQISVRQTTRFPEDSTVEFTLGTDRPVEFGLKIRSPLWLAGPITARLNVDPVTIQSDASHWCTLRRQWKSGDRLSIRLPMRLWVSRFASDRAYPAAILYGPVVLAARATDSGFVRKIDLDHLDRDLTPVPGEELTWRLARDGEVLLRPFYAYKEGEPYHLYLDPAAGSRVPPQAIRFGPNWRTNGPNFHFSNAVGTTAECVFEGTGIRWRGSRFDDAGRAEVAIDGKAVAIVDQYGPGRGLPFEWSRRKLPPGRHTILLKVLEEKSPQSKDRYINVASFEVYHDQ